MLAQSHNMPTRSTESYDKFVARHGGRPIEDRGRYLLPSGAFTTNDGVAPRLHEPPPDSVERLTLARRYHELSVERVEQDFDTLKSALLGHRDQSGFAITWTWPVGEYGNPPGPVSDGKAALNRLKEIGMVRRFRLRQIEQRIAAHPQVQAEQQRQQYQKRNEAERQAQARETHREIAEINL